MGGWVGGWMDEEKGRKDEILSKLNRKENVSPA